MQALRIPLRVVFYREDGEWVAHCLEFDLVGSGVTKADALAGLSDAIQSQVEESVANDNPRNLFSPADGEYFQMFAAGKGCRKKFRLLPEHGVTDEEFFGRA